MPDNYDAWLKQINPYLEEKLVSISIWRLFHGQIGITEEVLSQTQEKISIFSLQTRHVTMRSKHRCILDLTDILDENARS